MNDSEVFRQLLGFSMQDQFENFIYGKSLSVNERSAYTTKFLKVVKDKGTSDVVRAEAFFQLAVLNLSADESAISYGFIGDALTCAGSAGGQALRRTFVDCWPLVAYLVMQRDVAQPKSASGALAFIMKSLEARIGSKKDLEDWWPFVATALNLVQAMNIARVEVAEGRSDEAQLLKLRAANDASYLDVASRGQFRFTEWVNKYW